MEQLYRKTETAGHIYTEGSVEYVLPDYQGDIKKILSTETWIRPTGKYINAAEAQFAGHVCFEVVYLDAQEKLTVASFISDYEFSSSVEEGSEDAAAHLQVASCNIRVPGPRKMAVKYTLCARVLSCTEDVLSATGSAVGEDVSAQLRKKDVLVRHTVLSQSEEKEYTATARLPEDMDDTAEILRSGAAFSVSGLHFENGTVTLKGELHSYADLMANGVPHRLRTRQSIEESWETVGAIEGMDGLGGAGIRDVQLSIGSDTDGHPAVVWTVNAVLYARGEENQPLTTVRDGYLCTYETDNAYADFSYEEYRMAKQGEGTLSATFPLPKEDSNIGRVFYTSAAVKSLSAVIDGADACLKGEVSLLTVGLSEENGNVRYHAVKNTMPVDMKLPLGLSLSDADRLDVEWTLGETTALLDGTSLAVEVPVAYAVTVTRPNTVKVLSTMNLRTDAPIPSREGVVTVLYPTPSDTLFDIAKQYHTTVAALASDNALDEKTALQDGGALTKKLFILP